MTVQTDKLIRELVIARLKSLPSGKKISIGSHGEFNSKELIERIQEGDEIGKKVIEIQLEYLRSLKAILSEDPHAHHPA